MKLKFFKKVFAYNNRFSFKLSKISLKFSQFYQSTRMLQLARKKGEAIIINDSIQVKVLEIKGKVVRLGFEFPKGVSVLRQELYEKIQNDALIKDKTPLIFEESAIGLERTHEEHI